MNSTLNNDKQIEYERYNAVSKRKIVTGINPQDILKDGSSAIALYLQTPYLYYENLLGDLIAPTDNVLDLCCGDGIHTLNLGKLAKSVTAVDIAENSIELAKEKANHANIKNIVFFASDVEALNIGEGLFDVITCVGSLSYLDMNNVINVINYHLKPGGNLIILDSFNHNIIYRLNRYIHYLKGQRSYSTLKRMPNKHTISRFQKEFQKLQVSYFGIFTFLAPIFVKLFSPSTTKNIIDALDKRLRFLRRYSFKIVLVAQKKE